MRYDSVDNKNYDDNNNEFTGVIIIQCGSMYVCSKVCSKGIMWF